MDRHHSTHRSFRYFIDDKLTVPALQPSAGMRCEIVHHGQPRHDAPQTVHAGRWEESWMKAYEAIAQSLMAESVTDFFGLMGDGNMWLWGALCRNASVKAYSARHRLS
jgi:hypothetical protein